MARRTWVASILVLVLAVSTSTTSSAFSSGSNATAWAWGANSNGELGNGTITRYSGLNSPVQVLSLSGVKAVAGGNEHSLALKTDGTVWAWGDSGWGQLGTGAYGSSSTPVQVALTGTVTAIAAGYLHSLALKSDGSVWAWGFNYYGQVGTSPSGNNVLAPVQIPGLQNVIGIAAGSFTSYAVRSDGSVVSWGYDGQGELGNGTADENPHVALSRVRNLPPIAAVAGGGSHALALSRNGTVFSWGDNQSSQLGAPTAAICSQYHTACSRVPLRVAGLSGITALAGGASFSLARAADGVVWGWGDNGYGQLGTGSSRPPGAVKQPVRTGFSNAVAIAAGASHTVILKADGTAWASGNGDLGQLGQGAFTESSTPVKVLVDGLTAIGAGQNHSLGVQS